MYDQFSLWSCTNFMFKAYYSHPVFTFPYTFMKRCFIWEGKQAVILWLLSEDCTPFPQTFQYFFSGSIPNYLKSDLKMGDQNISYVQSTLAVPCMVDVCFRDSKENISAVHLRLVSDFLWFSLTWGSQLFYSLTTHLDLCFSAAAKWWAPLNKVLMWICCVEIPLFCL